MQNFFGGGASQPATVGIQMKSLTSTQRVGQDPLSKSIDSGSVKGGSVLQSLASAGKYALGVGVMLLKGALDVANVLVVGLGGAIGDLTAGALCGAVVCGLGGAAGGAAVGAIAGGIGAVPGAIVFGGAMAAVGVIGGAIVASRGLETRAKERTSDVQDFYRDYLNDLAASLMGGQDVNKA